MATFHYQGVTRTGKNIKGTKDAISRQSALKELTAEGYFISDLIELDRSKKKRSLFFSKKKNLSDLFFQLALLLNSGIPLVESLNIIAQTSNKGKEHDILLEIAGKVSEGIKFSEALAAHDEYFEPMYVNLIKASEHMGRLADVLMDIATYEENKGKQTDKLKSAMIYPMVILIIGVAVVALMMVFVVPSVQDVFTQTEQELPLATKALLAISAFVQNYAIFIVLLLITAMIAYRYFYRNNNNFRMKIDKKMYSFNLVAHSIVARFCHILAFQLKEGIPLTDALHHSTLTVTNRFVANILSNVREQVQSGVRFSNAVKQAGIFPDLFPAAVSTGESSGNMPDLLERVSIFYNKKLDMHINTFLTIIEPAMIVLIGGMVVFIAIAIMLPLMSINTMIE